MQNGKNGIGKDLHHAVIGWPNDTSSSLWGEDICDDTNSASHELNVVETDVFNSNEATCSPTNHTPTLSNPKISSTLRPLQDRDHFVYADASLLGLKHPCLQRNSMSWGQNLSTMHHLLLVR